jgi:DNA-binding CsgD family transcriptional regulator
VKPRFWTVKTIFFVGTPSRARCGGGKHEGAQQPDEQEKDSGAQGSVPFGRLPTSLRPPSPRVYGSIGVFCGVVTIPGAQREALLDFVLLAAEEQSARPFPEPVVDAFRRVIPCDTVAYRAWSRHDVLDRSFAPDELAERWPVWLRYPLFRHDDPHPSELPPRNGNHLSAATHDAGPLLLSDAAGTRFWHTGLYFELMRPFGIRDVLKLFLPPQGSEASVFVFDTSGRGFDEGDQTILVRLVPALVQLQLSARLRSTVVDDEWLQRLTPRELTVLARVAAGESNVQIARALVVSTSTVRKHLEHVYEKLEVRNRAAATAIYSRAAGCAAGTRESRP